MCLTLLTIHYVKESLRKSLCNQLKGLIGGVNFFLFTAIGGVTNVLALEYLRT